MRSLALILLLLCSSSMAQDISNPLKLLAVGDKQDHLIEIVDVNKGRTMHRFETAFRPDHILMTPYAPILMYTNTESRIAVFYSLVTLEETGRLQLPVVPRHVVLDVSGGKAGITDSESGGFALVSLYGKNIEFSLPDFPATGDVLFDPNEVDIYYTNSMAGTLGVLDINLKKYSELKISDSPNQRLSSPSRSLDARYIYVANQDSGEVYSLNAFSKVIYRTFEVGNFPARPYTTPQGSFLYMTDLESGRFLSMEQGVFKEYADTQFEHGVDLVTVGRFDRFNLFLGTAHKHWYIYDNISKSVVSKGEFKGQPIDAFGAADGKTAYVAFADIPELAMVNLEHQAVRYFPATNNGAGSFTIGLSNNVCH